MMQKGVKSFFNHKGVRSFNLSSPISYVNRVCFSTTTNLSGTQQKGEENVKLFDKILIANRGEIACRVMKTAHDLGIKTVAVYSTADKYSQHVQQATEAYCIGEAESAKSYLLQDVVLDVAKKSGAQAIHPGYGFLSENAHFALKCEKEGVVFIGPPASAIKAMGSKSESKNLMQAANVPVVPGYHGENQDDQFLLEEAKKIGFPVLIKAVLGGGGKGMKIVHRESEFLSQLASARREAQASFSDSVVLLEKYIQRPRHIELQVFGDKYGNYVHLFERDCSVQRRHQKIIEEAPSPGLSTEKRRFMGQSAVDAAKAVGYVGAGTVEFIVDQDDNNNYYFMEMNTRLQVEHPVTEMITRQDLVEWQIRVAAGGRLPLKQEQIPFVGHSFEARIYAEDPDDNFMPNPGKLLYLKPPKPEENRIRVETGVVQGDSVSIYYDPMIAKLVVWGENRDKALKLLKQCLDDYHIAGITTNIQFLKRLCVHPEFIAANVETHFIQKYGAGLILSAEQKKSLLNDKVLMLGALSTVIREKERVLSESNSNTNDMTSPFKFVHAARVNHKLSRDISFNEAEQPISIQFDGKDIFTVRIGEASYEVSSVKLTPLSDKRDSYHVVLFANEAKIEATVVFLKEGDPKIAIFTNYDGNYYELTPTKAKIIGGLKGSLESQSSGSIRAPKEGKIKEKKVKVGDEVKKGDVLLVLDSMKMETTITAQVDGKIISLVDKETVPKGAVLVEIEEKSE